MQRVAINFTMNGVILSGVSRDGERTQSKDRY
jgi:hypothetical protein